MKAGQESQKSRPNLSNRLPILTLKMAGWFKPDPIQPILVGPKTNGLQSNTLLVDKPNHKYECGDTSQPKPNFRNAHLHVTNSKHAPL